MKKQSKKFTIVKIILILLTIVLIIPFLINFLINKNNLKALEKDANQFWNEKIKDVESGYFNKNSIDFTINKVFKTEYGYGVDITFKAKSDYAFDSYEKFAEIEYSSALYDFTNANYSDVLKTFKYGVFKLELNGEEKIAHYFPGEENDYSDTIVYEYSNGKYSVKKLPLFTLLTLIVIWVVSFTVFAVYYDSVLRKKNSRIITVANISMHILKYLAIYIMIGLLTGGMGFIALPLLLLLEGKN